MDKTTSSWIEAMYGSKNYTGEVEWIIQVTTNKNHQKQQQTDTTYSNNLWVNNNKSQRDTSI